MKRIAVNSNFYLDEFVDPYTYLNMSDHGISLLDTQIFDFAQLLRYHYMEPVYINNWWSMYEDLESKGFSDFTIIRKIEKANSKGLVNIWSGIRTKRCKIGSRTSAHLTGQAIDPKGNEKRFFQIVKDNAAVFYSLGLKRLEDISITDGWLHMDSLDRHTKPNSIRVIDRTKMTEIINI